MIPSIALTLTPTAVFALATVGEALLIAAIVGLVLTLGWMVMRRQFDWLFVLGVGNLAILAAVWLGAV